MNFMNVVPLRRLTKKIRVSIAKTENQNSILYTGPVVCRASDLHKTLKKKSFVVIGLY